MKNQTLVSALLCILIVCAWTVPSGANSSTDDGLTDRDRTEIYGSPGSGCDSRTGTGLDLIIVSTTKPVVFFGLYRTSQMTLPGWDLYERAVDWANGFQSPATTKVWLATYNGTLDPKYSGELDGIAVHDYLINTMGFLPANIHVAHQDSIEKADFTGFDLVLYVFTYPRDATNVMNQDKPFVTTCAAETDELGIGTGVNMMHQARNYGYIINNTHHITSPYTKGKFTLSKTMWMDATEVSGNGRALAKTDLFPLEADMITLSEALGGKVNFYLDAGPVNAFRNYLLIGGVTGTTPGTTLPGGLATLPVNWDVFSDLVMTLLNSPVFFGFLGSLDAGGTASAQLFSPALPPGTAGLIMYYAYCLNNPFDFASNPVKIEVIQ